MDISRFQADLLAWYHAHHREMPWRQTRDPYAIWISEAMLQQTQVATVIPYYHRFLARFPTVESLAEAPMDDVLKLWEGLGYYSRARNLQRAAQLIVAEHGGQPPADYDALLSLPGFGPYTAAAVGSIAFGLPEAVLDGNVIRVIARLERIDKDVTKPTVKAALQGLADRFLDPESPGDHNQAMMELGATICTPRVPACPRCPVSSHCRVREELADPSVLPFKAPRKARPHYQIAVGLIWNSEGKLLIARRPDQGLLGGLWEFPGGKQEPGEALAETCVREIREELGIEAAVRAPFRSVDHGYTHFSITMHAFHCDFVSGMPKPLHSTAVRWVSPDELVDFAFPKANKVLIDVLMNQQQGDLFSSTSVA